MDRIRKMIHCTDTLGMNGEGICVEVLDSGIANHPDFEHRVVAFRDFTNTGKTDTKYFDDHGHGTHVSWMMRKAGI